MQDFLDQEFVLSHTLQFSDPTDGQMRIAGEVLCLGGITIQVDKTLLILKGSGPAAIVRTVDYRYHVYADGLGNLFRYCSPHGDGHRLYHHVHRFDVFDTWEEIVPVKEIWDGNDVPTLGDVIEEARDLYYSRDDFDEL